MANLVKTQLHEMQDKLFNQELACLNCGRAGLLILAGDTKAMVLCAVEESHLLQLTVLQPTSPGKGLPGWAFY